MTKQEILETIELRQSTLKSWLNCPLLYKFRHIDGMEPEFRYPATLHGTALHEALKILHEFKLKGDVTALYSRALNQAIYGSDESHIPVRWKKGMAEDVKALKRNAIEILENYRKKEYNQQVIVLFSEVEFKVKILGYEFTGTIDQVRKNHDGSLELIDFKSGMQRPNLYAVKNDIQLTLYAYALKFGELLVDGIWVKPNMLVDSVAIYFLRGHESYKRKVPGKDVGDEKSDPFIRVSKSIQDLRNFRKEVRGLLSAMLKPWYYPNTASCAFCAYKSQCDTRNDNIPDSDINMAHELLAEVELEE